jgi:hypothetical protein
LARETMKRNAELEEPEELEMRGERGERLGGVERRLDEGEGPQCRSQSWSWS